MVPTMPVSSNTSLFTSSQKSKMDCKTSGDMSFGTGMVSPAMLYRLPLYGVSAERVFPDSQLTEGYICRRSSAVRESQTWEAHFQIDLSPTRSA
jgi:hypothetical protein